MTELTEPQVLAPEGARQARDYNDDRVWADAAVIVPVAAFEVISKLFGLEAAKVAGSESDPDNLRYDPSSVRRLCGEYSTAALLGGNGHVQTYLKDNGLDGDDFIAEALQELHTLVLSIRSLASVCIGAEILIKQHSQEEFERNTRPSQIDDIVEAPVAAPEIPWRLVVNRS